MVDDLGRARSHRGDIVLSKSADRQHVTCDMCCMLQTMLLLLSHGVLIVFVAQACGMMGEQVQRRSIIMVMIHLPAAG